MGGNGFRCLLSASFAALACLAVPVAAAAETFHASPDGEKLFCTPTVPCSLATALEDAEDGDEISLAAGNYEIPPGGIAITRDIAIGGSPEIRPALLADQAAGIEVSPDADASLHDLRIEGEAWMALGGSSAERVFVSTSNPDRSACELGPGASLRDSVCWAHPLEAKAEGTRHAIEIAGQAPGVQEPVELRNVTAYTTAKSGNAIRALATAGAKLDVEAENVIARSRDDVDVFALYEGAGEPEIQLSLSSSSFATFRDGPTERALVTEPQTNGNQTAPPLFANAADGDFHMLADSPTQDQGIAGPADGPFDLDGLPRVQAKCAGGEPRIDIGAYERPGEDCRPPPPPPPPGPPPFSAIFRVVAVKTNKRGGGQVYVEVPATGILSMTGSGIKLVRRNAPPEGGMVALPIQTWAITKARLAKRGKTKVRLNVIFEGRGGGVEEWSKGVVLRQKVST